MAYFRPNTWDSNIWHSIVYHNEYNIHSDWPHYVIDVGGHIGSFSYFITHIKGAKKVVVVEPDTENYLVLRSNLADLINNGTVIAINAGIGDPQTKLSLVHKIHDNTGGMSYTPSDSGDVPSITLDSLIDLLPQDNTPTLLKIDCEGCEYSAFQFCKKLSRINSIVGEFHIRDSNNQETIRNILESNGFLFNSHFTGSNYIGLFGAHRP